MSTSWDLLQDTMEETMEEVNNVLGDFLIHQIEHDKSSLADLYPSESQPPYCDYRPPLGQEFEAVKEDMEPQPRARSNTWPKRQFGLKTGESIGLPQVNEETSSELGVGQSSSASGRYLVNNSPGEVPASPLHRKNSRRNPWGNCSYSDLIEQVRHTLLVTTLTLSPLRPSSPPQTRGSPSTRSTTGSYQTSPTSVTGRTASPPEAGRYSQNCITEGGPVCRTVTNFVHVRFAS